MMRNIRMSLISACSAMLMMSTDVVQAQSKTNSDKVVALVGSEQITQKELNDRYAEIQNLAINPPSKEVFLEDLVRYKLGLQEAMKRKLQDDPVVKDRMQQEIYKGLLERDLGKKVAAIKVSENEMQNYYKRNPEIRTSHILIEFRPDATEDQKQAARKRAEEIYSEVKTSKRPFEELVNLYTDDVLSKRTGGDVGWQSSVTLVPPYYQAALKMKVGEIRGLIETRFGYHIIKVTGRRGYNDANKRQIRAAVFDEKRKQIFDVYFAELKKQYPIKINKGAL